MRPITGAGAALAGALLLSLYVVLPLPARTFVQDAAGFGCAAAIVVGLRRHRPPRPAPWVLLATGSLLLGLGNVTFTVYRYDTGAVPFPSWADALVLAAYTVLAVALSVVVRRSRARDALAWQDAATWAVAGLLVGGEWLREPMLAAGGGSSAAAAVAVGYPVLDLVLLLLLVRLVASRAGSPRVCWGVALSLGCFLVSDALYVLHGLSGGAQASAAVGLGWLACYLGLAATALHPSMVELGAAVRQPSRGRGDRRQQLLIVVALLSPAVAALHDLRMDGEDFGLILVGASTLFVLTSLRGARLLRELARLTGELQAREGELEHRATRDALTGLSNRAVLQEQLRARFEGDEPFSVALIDLDEFKAVNDTRGHDVGDQLLISVADCLRAGLGPAALVSRLGGDEFAVLADGAPQPLAALLDRCLRSCVSPGTDAPVRASIGICSSSCGADTRVELLRHADLAMYVAKRAGGGEVRIYEPSMSQDATDELDRHTRLASAVEAGELTAWFQPVIELDTGRLTGVEALVRWERPGCVPEIPHHWMATAEQSDLIVAVDLQVLGLAARQLGRWAQEAPGAGVLELSVNVSGRSLREPDIVERVLSVVAQEGLAPGRLVLEVAEQTLLDESVGPRLQQLRAAGVRIALDDYGTGWSSLASLERFPVDRLKIDRSFLVGLGDAGAAQVLPAAVLQLASALRLDVVAEGVETRAEAEVLLALGCRSAQGYLFAHPAPAAQLTRVVRDGRLPVVPRPRPAEPQAQTEAQPQALDLGAELDEAAS